MKTVYRWIGREGYNPIVGRVEHGQLIELDQEKADFLLSRGQIKIFASGKKEKPQKKYNKEETE